MSKSILSNVKQCFVCETQFNLHRHHIFFGSGNRSLSEKYGCWCYLCGRHHNLSNEGVHFRKELDIELKKYTQERFEEMYPELDFIKIFGRNYLEV